METIRQEAERRGVSHGKVWKERDAETLINQKGRDVDIVYAWRWSDDTYAKIGVSTVSGLRSRVDAAKTYHPTDEPILLYVRECRSRKEAKRIKKALLTSLNRVHPNREWVIIDDAFKNFFDPEPLFDPESLTRK